MVWSNVACRKADKRRQRQVSGLYPLPHIGGTVQSGKAGGNLHASRKPPMFNGRSTMRDPIQWAWDPKDVSPDSSIPLKAALSTQRAMLQLSNVSADCLDRSIILQGLLESQWLHALPLLPHHLPHHPLKSDIYPSTTAPSSPNKPIS